MKKPATGLSESRKAGSETLHLRFFVQIHSFKTQEQADSALSSLQKRGYNCFVELVHREQSEWYVVYSGPYGELQEALGRAHELQRSEKTRPVIVRRSVRTD